MEYGNNCCLLFYFSYFFYKVFHYFVVIFFFKSKIRIEENMENRKKGILNNRECIFSHIVDEFIKKITIIKISIENMN